MEGRPRSQEHPEDDDSTESRSSTRKRKFRPIGLNNYLERAVLKDDAGERASKPWFPRFERIKKHEDVKSILPSVEPVLARERAEAKTDKEDEDEEDEDTDTETTHDQLPAVEVSPTSDYYETWSPEDIEAITSESDSTSEQSDENEENEEALQRVPSFTNFAELRPSESTHTERDAQPTQELESELDGSFEDEDFVAENDEIELDEHSPINPEENEQSPQQELPVTEPESIDSILRRRAREQATADTDNSGTATGGETIIHNNITNNETNIYNENRNTGLHLLNYALARRRDTRDRKAAGREFKRVDSRIDQLAKKTELEKQQNRSAGSVEMHTVFERPKLLENHNVANYTTLINEKNITTNAEQVSTKITNKFEQQSERAALTPEQLLQQVAEAVERQDGIQSEAVFESRHEIKDVASPISTGQSIALSDNASSSGQVPVPSLPIAQQNYAMPVNPSGDSHSDSKSSTPHQELIMTGAWGVVVGIIVFIIFYVLTR